LPAQTLKWIPSGDAGSFATLDMMRRLANAALTDPVVVKTARSAIAVAGPRDRDEHARAIKRYMQESFQFVSDPRGVETLSTPRAMLLDIQRRGMAQGDCDEAAILAAALGKAVGLRAQYVVVGFYRRGAPFVHVFTILRGTTGWLSLDVTRPMRPDLPPVTRRKHVEV